MSEYTPDRWVMLEITGLGSKPIRKIFAGWYGGFGHGDTWKLNSGIVTTTFVENFYEFEGYSGSTYYCHPNGYGTSMYMQSVLDRWLAQSETLEDMQIRVLDLAEVARL